MLVVALVAGNRMIIQILRFIQLLLTGATILEEKAEADPLAKMVYPTLAAAEAEVQ